MSSLRRTFVAVGGLITITVGSLALIRPINASRHPTSAATIEATYIEVMSLALTLASPLVAWWWKGRSSHAAQHSTREQLDTVSNLLADQVASRWREEAARRRITTPAPIPVEWRWVGDAIAAPKGEVMERLPPGLGVSTMPGYDEMAVAPDAGMITNLHDELYARLPYGRLVILGTPGSGKTSAMILLLLAALDRRSAMSDEERMQVPVPVWLSLGSWTPRRLDWQSWAVTTISRDYPALRAPEYGSSAAEELLRNRRVALFLDGLDELPATTRTEVLRSISKHGHGLRIVLTSRSGEYRDTVPTTLNHAAVVHLRPVQAKVAGSYLLHQQVGAHRHEWANIKIFVTEHPESTLAQALSNPFVVSLVRDCFSDSDPAVLTDSQVFPTVKTIHEHLIGRLFVEAYPSERGRNHATKWLSWIARRMESQPDLVWWQMADWLPKYQIRIARGLIGGLTIALGFLAGEAIFGWYAQNAETAVGIGLLAGCIIGFKPTVTVPRSFAFDLGARFRKFWKVSFTVPSSVTRASLVAGTVVGLFAGVLNGFANKDAESYFARGLIGNLLTFLASASLIGLLVATISVIIGTAFSWLMRLCTTPIIDSQSATAFEAYRADRRVGLVISLVAGVPAASFLFIVTPGSTLQRIAFAFLLATGLGATVGFGSGAVPLVKSAELVLNCRGLGRVRFQRLLEGAYNKQLLRQAGAIYQFRHQVIQEYLATTSATTSPTRSTVIQASEAAAK